MSFSVNKAILLGHVGQDPEIRTAEGKRFARFSLATGESWKDKDSGERRERTYWHTVVTWNEDLVALIEKRVKKGSKVYVEGAIKPRTWEDDKGIKRYATDIVLDRFAGQIVLLDANGSGFKAPESPDDYGQGDSFDTRRGPASESPRTTYPDDENPF